MPDKNPSPKPSPKPTPTPSPTKPVQGAAPGTGQFGHGPNPRQHEDLEIFGDTIDDAV